MNKRSRNTLLIAAVLTGLGLWLMLRRKAPSSPASAGAGLSLRVGPYYNPAAPYINESALAAANNAQTFRDYQEPQYGIPAVYQWTWGPGGWAIAEGKTPGSNGPGGPGPINGAPARAPAP